MVIMSSRNNKTRPTLCKAKICQGWLKLIKTRRKLTDPPNKKQSLAIVLSLKK